MSSLGVETAEDTVRYITLSLCFGFSFSGKVCDVGGDEYFFESEGKSSLIVFTDVTGASRTGRPGPGPVAVARPKAGRRAGVGPRARTRAWRSELAECRRNRRSGADFSPRTVVGRHGTIRLLSTVSL